MGVGEEDVEDNISSEEEENVKYETPKQLVFTIEILKLIKDAQQQHGLRHGDYQRYRGYCTRRIRRLRKVLKITQGDKRHFKRKDVTEAMLKDERFLYIPLMMAERAWGCAMQLRQEANTETRKRFHLVGRLRKATKYALHLESLCESSRCDARTKLEAQAYVAWIYGALNFELQLWKPAMENLKKAQMVYEKLASALPEEDQVIYKARVDELTPSLRYCAYNIGDESSIDDLLQMRGQGQGDLLANLDSLIVQTREHRAEVLCEVEWRGRSVPVRPERVRAFLLAEQELQQSLSRAEDNAAKISLYETLLMDCKDAVAALRDEIKADPGSKVARNAAGAGPLSALQHLLSYLTHIRLNLTVRRNLLMVDAAKSSLVAEGGTGERKVRPQDLTRLYEIILQNLGELQQLPGLEEDSQYKEEVELKMTAYKAFRCFYIAQSLVVLRRWREAVALYQRSDQYAQDALKGKLEASLKTELQALKKEIAGQAFSVHAQSVLEDEKLQDEEGIVPGSKKDVKSKKPLFDRLEEYREDPSLTSRNPNVYKLPPEMEPIPCKPLFFDLAFNFVEFPSLEDKIETSPTGGKKAGAAGITGFVKGLWGWGGGKK